MITGKHERAEKYFYKRFRQHIHERRKKTKSVSWRLRLIGTEQSFRRKKKKKKLRDKGPTVVSCQMNIIITYTYNNNNNNSVCYYIYILIQNVMLLLLRWRRECFKISLKRERIVLYYFETQAYVGFRVFLRVQQLVHPEFTTTDENYYSNCCCVVSPNYYTVLCYFNRLVTESHYGPGSKIEPNNIKRKKCIHIHVIPYIYIYKFINTYGTHQILDFVRSERLCSFLCVMLK